MKNVHIYPSTGKHESRVFRSCKVAVKSEIYDEVIFYVVHSNEVVQSQFPNIKLREIASSRIGYLAKLFFVLSKKDLVINVHNWYLLMPAMFSALIFRNKIIYEPHEVEFGTSYISSKSKKVCHFLEKTYFKHFDSGSSVFVGESVKQAYESAYEIEKSHIVRSIPSLNLTEQSRTQKSNLRTGCYVGLLTFGRGIESYIQLVEDQILDKFVFIGHGPEYEFLKNLCEQNAKFELLDSMQEQKLYEYLSETKPICFSLMDIKSLSNRCASPNKFFIYLYSGCPMVYSNYGDQAIISSQFKTGCGVESMEYSVVIDAVKKVQSNFVEYSLPELIFNNESTENYELIHRNLT